MTSIFSFTNPPFLKAADLDKEELHDTIGSIDRETFDGNETKPVLTLENDGRRLPLNRTNIANCVAAFGSQIEDWIGKPVILRGEPTTFQGKTIKEIRVYPDHAAMEKNVPGATNNPFDQYNSEW